MFSFQAELARQRVSDLRREAAVHGRYVKLVSAVRWQRRAERAAHRARLAREALL